MANIEEGVMSKLQNSGMNEATTYRPNQLLANAIGDYITTMGFLYTGYINEPNSDELGIPVQIDVELNGDDVDVTMSDNVMYCYINADKIDHILKPAESIYNLDNFSEILKNHRFVPVNAKTWRDATKLYLLKINLNSGIIGRYDINTGRFKNQEVNWNSSTPEEITELLLTKDYLQEYLSHELCSLESYVSFITAEEVRAKIESEAVIN